MESDIYGCLYTSVSTCRQWDFGNGDSICVLVTPLVCGGGRGSIATKSSNNELNRYISKTNLNYN